MFIVEENLEEKEMEFPFTINRQICRKGNSSNETYGNSNEAVHKNQEKSFVAMANVIWKLIFHSFFDEFHVLIFLKIRYI